MGSYLKNLLFGDTAWLVEAQDEDGGNLPQYFTDKNDQPLSPALSPRWR
jgi:hypothetical protein